MVTSSHTLKAEANAQFAGQDYTQAISTYDRALAELPSYLDYEMAVLQSNIAACHLRLEQWKEAVQSCEKGLDGLEREMPTKPKSKTKKGKTKPKESSRTRLNSDTESEDEIPKEPEQQDDTIVELDSDQDEATALASLNLSDARKEDIHRIRTKLLLRRARGRSSMPAQSGSSTWANLSGALEDYKLLSTPKYFSTLPLPDQKTVRAALLNLPPQVDKAKEKEVGEMMGKLKELGNGILKPFGLSTNNFKVVQGEGGGYSLSFDSGGGGGGEQKK
jgi:tetratricopeptide (TPR) repeat protein